jgi:serine/threonine-protein kinase RsbW
VTASSPPMDALLEDPEIELAFPPRPEHVRMARHTLAALARLHDLDDDAVEDLKLAVSEACTHAVSVNAKNGGEPVRVLASVTGAVLTVEVHDAGPGIDPGLVERAPEFDSNEFTFEKGLSLPLIDGLVDELEVLPGQPRGAVVRMRLSFGSRDEQPVE